MEAWSCDQVAEWLRENNFGEYIDNFLEQAVDGACLVELDEDMLKNDLQVMKLGRRKALMKAIKEYDDSSNVLDLAVLHAAPLVLERMSKEGKHLHPMEKLDLDVERSAFQDVLQRNILQKRIQTRYDVATADSFRSLLTAWQIKVLHFSGHGVGLEEKLCFEDNCGGTHLISPAMLSELIHSGGSSSTTFLQVVFVSACHSEKVARVFVDAGVPHVVAVHSVSKIVDESAKDFAKQFYLALFAGKTVAAAFDIAKTAVRMSPSSRRACCCAHLHEKTCKWNLTGGSHSRHAPNSCCCKGHLLPWPHDESSKFLLLGHAESHEVVVFPKLPRGNYTDLTPSCLSNIPAMPKQFMGRNIETYNLVRSISHGHVTVCTGAPGIGKSSLAMAAAHYILQRRICPDGVFYVDLEGLELSAVKYAIARSVGLLTGESESSSDAEVFAELGSKRCLLVLDKVEELLDRDEHKCQEWLGQLVGTATQTRFLLASRRCPVIPNVTVQPLSISELPPQTSADLLRLSAPQCSIEEARTLARICGYLPLALRVIGRALANTRSNLTAQDLIDRLQVEDKRLIEITGLPNAGEKECIDRCIRSSFDHLDRPLQLAFMALGLFRGVFDRHAAAAVLQSVPSVESSLSKSYSAPSILSDSRSGITRHFSHTSLGQIDETQSVTSTQSLGDQLLKLDDFQDPDDALTNQSYLLLNLESKEEVLASVLDVRSAEAALEQLNNWSLLERVKQHKLPHHLPRPTQYRLHNMIQLFAEEEANKRSFETPESHALFLTWRRRFVRHYCMILATASHKFRYSGNLTQFDENRSNIESALRVGQQLARHSEDLARELLATETLQEVEYTPVIDVLLYGNLIARGRFIFRVRFDPRKRMELFQTSIQLSKAARVLNCKCGHAENNSDILMDGFDFDCTSHSYETPSKDAPPCECSGVMELLSLEVLMLMEMGYAYYDVMEYGKSEHMYRESLRLQKDVLHRNDHSHVAEVMNYLGICLSTRKGYHAVNPWNFRNAETLLIEAKAMRERVLGTNHPDYATSLNNLGNFYKAALQMISHKDESKDMKFGWGGVLLKTEDDIKEFYTTSLSIRELNLGRDHPHVAQSLNNLALFRSHMLDKTPKDELPDEEGLKQLHVEIEQLYSRALDIRRKKLGANSPDTASTLNNLGNFKYNQGAYPAAEVYCKEALKIRKQYYQQDNDRVAQSLINVGRILVAQEKYAEAEHVYKEALELRRILMPDSKEVAFCLEKIGRCKIRMGQHDEGARLLSEGQLMKRRSGLSSLSSKMHHSDSYSTLDSMSDTFSDTSFEKLFLSSVLSPETMERNEELNIDGRLIGTKGARLKEVQHESRARVTYNSIKKVKDMAFYQFFGTSDQMAIAKEMCIKMLESIQEMATKNANGDGNGNSRHKGNNHQGSSSQRTPWNGDRPPRSNKKSGGGSGSGRVAPPQSSRTQAKLSDWMTAAPNGTGGSNNHRKKKD
ncbi:hypothetical protein Ae201684P_018088 [Aphanomyces euteiches]|uniref:SAM domain-containing protein n=1 Tax=Aphanomyces euteiches TaxID=100861 RepID=A0A6G0X3G2_9STRA|nr:hypothetical protein Ae201684_008937 [Aphanomyces euteiches]KAH9054367.1 hypothetical protein Ae201684P_018088 [Aphanomyces euteiches]KAH9145668.1 hypothetical protein AeRB84_010431 [Aphanomyces euteiches]